MVIIGKLLQDSVESKGGTGPRRETRSSPGSRKFTQRVERSSRNTLTTPTPSPQQPHSGNGSSGIVPRKGRNSSSETGSTEPRGFGTNPLGLTYVVNGVPYLSTCDVSTTLYVPRCSFHCITCQVLPDRTKKDCDKIFRSSCSQRLKGPVVSSFEESSPSRRDEIPHLGGRQTPPYILVLGMGRPGVDDSGVTGTRRKKDVSSRHPRMGPYSGLGLIHTVYFSRV